MTENVQKMAPQILAEIKKSSRILLHFHPKPDGDSVGGALAMMHALKAMNKEVVVIKGDSNLPAWLVNLSGHEEVVTKSFSEVDLSKFDLFLILDSAVPGMISRQCEIDFPPTLSTVIIDHHQTNSKYAKLNLVDSTYPANCQLLYDLFVLWEVKITPDIATCLYLGLFTDTGGFKYQGVTKDTFEIATKLVTLSTNFTKIISVIENSNDIKQLEYEALVLGSLKSYFSGRVGIAEVPFSELQNKKISIDSMYGGYVVNRLLSVKDFDIVVLVTEEAENNIKMSLRSKNSEVCDVSKIGLVLGGGGHKAASGAFLKMSLEEARQKVLEAIATTYPTLGKA